MSGSTGVPSDDAQFGLANIPFGIASRNDGNGNPQVSTRLREQVYFLPELITNGLLVGLDESIAKALHQVSFNQRATLRFLEI